MPVTHYLPRRLQFPFELLYLHFLPTLQGTLLSCQVTRTKQMTQRLPLQHVTKLDIIKKKITRAGG